MTVDFKPLKDSKAGELEARFDIVLGSRRRAWLVLRQTTESWHRRDRRLPCLGTTTVPIAAMLGDVSAYLRRRIVAKSFQLVTDACDRKTRPRANYPIIVRGQVSK